MGRTAGRFARVEPRGRARAFVPGLLSDLLRKSCWMLAEQAGDATPIRSATPAVEGQVGCRHGAR
jgi:hypothetical protein